MCVYIYIYIHITYTSPGWQEQRSKDPRAGPGRDPRPQQLPAGAHPISLSLSISLSLCIYIYIYIYISHRIARVRTQRYFLSYEYISFNRIIRTFPLTKGTYLNCNDISWNHTHIYLKPTPPPACPPLLGD